MTALNAPRNSVPDYRLYRETPDEAADFWIHCEPIPDRTRLHRWEIGAHRHPALFQIFHVTEGGGEVLGEGRQLRFAAPCMLFIPPAAVHGFRFARDVNGVVVTALSDRLAPIAESDRRIAAFAQTIRIVDSPGGEMAWRLGRIANELALARTGRAALIEALIALIVIDMTRSWEQTDPAATGEAAADPRFTALIEAIEIHFRDGRPLDFYAELVGVSPSQINRIARRFSGLSVQALVARRIVQAARRDLLFTPTPVAAIAESLGFADPAYFNRFFRKHAGMTPGAYRDRERGKLERFGP